MIVNISDLNKEELDNYIFVDLREPIEILLHPVKEFKSVKLPFSQFSESNFQFKEDQSYILFCSKGMRSLLAAQRLHDQDIKNTASLTGGVDAIKSYFKK